MSVVQWLQEKLGMQQMAYGYPSVPYSAPIPARVPVAAAMSPTDDVSSSESASLVSSSSHKKGTSSDNRSSLVDGR